MRLERCQKSPLRLFLCRAMRYQVPVLYVLLEVRVRAPEPSSKVKWTFPSTSSMDKKSLCTNTGTYVKQTWPKHVWLFWDKFAGSYRAVGGEIEEQSIWRERFEEHDDAGGHRAQRLLNHWVSTAIKVKWSVFCPQATRDTEHVYSGVCMSSVWAGVCVYVCEYHTSWSILHTLPLAHDSSISRCYSHSAMLLPYSLWNRSSLPLEISEETHTLRMKPDWTDYKL